MGYFSVAAFVFCFLLFFAFLLSDFLRWPTDAAGAVHDVAVPPSCLHRAVPVFALSDFGFDVAFR